VQNCLYLKIKTFLKERGTEYIKRKKESNEDHEMIKSMRIGSGLTVLRWVAAFSEFYSQPSPT
jgi:hypothetical protein